MRRVRPAVFALVLGVTLLVVAPATRAATEDDLQDGTATGAVSATGTRWREYDYVLDAPGALSIRLDWTTPSADLNLFLRHPEGHFVAMDTSTTTKPAGVSWQADATGTWKVGVKAKTGSSDYTLTATLGGEDGGLQDGVATGSLSSTGTRWKEYRYDVAAPGNLSIQLDWATPSADLNLFLRHPEGYFVAMDTSTTTKPAEVSWQADATGTWKVGVKAKTGSSDYTLTAQLGGGTAAASTFFQTWAPAWMAGTTTVSETQAVQDATRFPLIVAHEQTYAGHVPAMRAANPVLDVLSYVNSVYAETWLVNLGEYPESWFAHDAAGNRVTSVSFGKYIMDVSNPLWWANRAEKCVDLTAETGYTGCFLDVLGPGPLLPGESSAIPINPNTGREWTESEWLEAVAQLASHVRTRLGDATVYGNAIGYGKRYFDPVAPSSQLFDALDGLMAEIFVRPATESVTNYRKESVWRQDVDMLVDAGVNGDRVLVTTKLWVPATTAQTDSWHEYALATFLLGTNGNSSFSFLPDRHQPTAGHPWWNLDIGTPAGNYSMANGVYQRDFTLGRVLVNPTDDPESAPVGPGWIDLDAGPVPDIITLAPHTAIILRLQ
jgi:hypothetical protein